MNRKIPVIDPSRCTECESCLAVCPEVFRKNGRTGLLEVVDLPRYPKDRVDEAIVICPADCISWES